MRLKPFYVLLFAAFPLCAAHVLLAQAAPSANDGTRPLAIGGGISNYDVDWGHGRMLGATVWADYTPSWLPARLRGLGVEAEARDISLHHSSSQPSNLREATLGGGPIYVWRHFRSFHPYFKGIASFGILDFKTRDPNYNYDSRTVLSAGGGFEYRVYRNLWARADYEYQDWPQLFGGQTLDPQGFTVGASYHFSRTNLH
jgi:opacity protein-like surface antigen